MEILSINPLPLSGPWDKGFSLDKHVLSSVPIGENAYGHMQFDTTRSAVGEALFQLKYRDQSEKVGTLAATSHAFVTQKWKLAVDVVIPAPFSKERAIQPVHAIAQSLAALLGVPCSAAVTKKPGTPQLKDLPEHEREKALQQALVVDSSVKNKRVLLVDDLYQSGTTLKVVTALLRHPGGVNAVSVLAMTRKY